VEEHWDPLCSVPEETLCPEAETIWEKNFIKIRECASQGVYYQNGLEPLGRTFNVFRRANY